MQQKSSRNGAAIDDCRIGTRGDVMEQHNDQEEIGPLLRRLRGETGLREVGRRTGISNSYLSQIERGDRRPGPSVLKRLASLYGVDVQDLLKRAGFLDDPEGVAARDDDPPGGGAGLPVRAGRPKFRVGARPSGPCPWRPSGSLSRCTNASPENGSWNDDDHDD